MQTIVCQQEFPGTWSRVPQNKVIKPVTFTVEMGNGGRAQFHIQETQWVYGNLVLG